MKKPTLRLLPLLAAVTLLGCGDETPTVTTPLTTPDPLTFEVHLPWSEFASNLRVVGGYGGPAQTRRGLLAHEFDNGLEARTLLRLGAYPSSVEVVDSLGTRRSETDISLVSGSLWMTVDTTEVDDVAPTTVTLGRLLEPWHARSATWALASDSGGVQVPWSEPGGGAVETLRRLTWFPQGREILIGLDSADIALIGDTTLAERGLIVSIESPGHRLYVPEVRMEVHAVPGINEDSTLFVPVDVTELTYVYTPSAAPPSGIHLRAGGGARLAFIVHARVAPDPSGHRPGLCSHDMSRNAGLDARQPRLVTAHDPTDGSGGLRSGGHDGLGGSRRARPRASAQEPRNRPPVRGLARFCHRRHRAGGSVPAGQLARGRGADHSDRALAAGGGKLQCLPPHPDGRTHAAS